MIHFLWICPKICQANANHIHWIHQKLTVDITNTHPSTRQDLRIFHRENTCSNSWCNNSITYAILSTFWKHDLLGMYMSIGGKDASFPIKSQKISLNGRRFHPYAEKRAQESTNSSQRKLQYLKQIFSFWIGLWYKIPIY